MTTHYQATRPRALPGHLTSAEARHVTELARGGDHDEVAARLQITSQSLRSSLARARRRLGATNSVHLLALAITAGDVDPDCADGTGRTT